MLERACKIECQFVHDFYSEYNHMYVYWYQWMDGKFIWTEFFHRVLLDFSFHNFKISSDLYSLWEISPVFQHISWWRRKPSELPFFLLKYAGQCIKFIHFGKGWPKFVYWDIKLNAQPQMPPQIGTKMAICVQCAFQIKQDLLFHTNGIKLLRPEALFQHYHLYFYLYLVM